MKLFSDQNAKVNAGSFPLSLILTSSSLLIQYLALDRVVDIQRRGRLRYFPFVRHFSLPLSRVSSSSTYWLLIAGLIKSENPNRTCIVFLLFLITFQLFFVRLKNHFTCYCAIKRNYFLKLRAHQSCKIMQRNEILRTRLGFVSQFKKKKKKKKKIDKFTCTELCNGLWLLVR